MLLIIAGMRRSGSTLAYQIGCAITRNEDGPRRIDQLPKGAENGPSWHVVKTHRYHSDESGKAKVVITTRDPRDIIVSMMTMKNESFEAALDRASWEVREYKRWLENADNLHIFRYENFYNNIKTLVKGIGKAIEVEISREEIAKIADRFSFENNRTRSQQATKTDSDFIFPGHIQDGIIGKWRIWLTKEQIAQVQEHVELRWFNEQER